MTGDSAQKGDLSAAKASFANTRKQCDTCHAGFREEQLNLLEGR